jgi:multidrug efflux pump subunit AcrA (membrane-fusion protein)
VVCELDADAFLDALLAQRIKYDQAKAWVIQAKSILEVNEISLREYRDGIYPQDLLLIRQYLATCRKEEDRARKNLEWSRPVYLKGFRTRAQYEADVLNMKRAEIALAEAERMEERLLKYTGPKILKSLQAKIEANRSDSLAQEAAFQIESDRQERLERMVANCTLRAPHEGIVVYSLGAGDMFRPPTTAIQEGATVREGQAIFEVPDDNKMRVKARVNESKVGLIQVGQKAVIRVDAFPDKPVVGTVTEVTAIPAPANGPSSDIKVYFANVNIDTGGFDGLRPGLSAEVSFFVDSRRDSTRVPLQTIRWANRVAYAALATAEDGSSYRWQPVEIGLMNESYAEILTGLKPGDRVVAHPEALPMPPASIPPALHASL